ncbi:DUF1289 domain-containing protein [Frigidibacter oleivorans]|uniref:DUF1289 domain-containing protein n=1 Tax=Frigidibacter oleivorans TaxID=2487129 RepID=UPI000F8D84F0|nr:DUF1289 domain-containing protein [Frigidibacter oleivorans]
MTEPPAAPPAAPVASPCIRLCRLDPETGLCLGCHRTLEEIAGWSAMDPAARQAVMAALPRRAAGSSRGEV